MGTTQSLEARLWGIKAVLRGVVERPLGHGAGSFQSLWPLYLTEEEQKRYLFVEYGAVEVYHLAPAYPFAEVKYKDREGGVVEGHIGLKAHNEFLDQMAAYGIPGGLLFLLLYGGALWRGLRRSSPWGLSLLALLPFLLTWYMLFPLSEIFFSVVALAYFSRLRHPLLGKAQGKP